MGPSKKTFVTETWEIKEQLSRRLGCGSRSSAEGKGPPPNDQVILAQANVAVCCTGRTWDPEWDGVIDGPDGRTSSWIGIFVGQGCELRAVARVCRTKTRCWAKAAALGSA